MMATSTITFMRKLIVRNHEKTCKIYESLQYYLWKFCDCGFVDHFRSLSYKQISILYPFMVNWTGCKVIETDLLSDKSFTSEEEWRIKLLLRDDVHKALEYMREEKRIGRSFDAIAYITYSNDDFVLDSEELRKFFCVSDVFQTWQTYRNYSNYPIKTEDFILPYIPNLMWKIDIVPAKEESRYIKCSRCWRYHQGLENYRSMCIRCHNVMLDREGDYQREYDARFKWLTVI